MASAVAQSLRGREAASLVPHGSLQTSAPAPGFPFFDRLLGYLVAAGQGVEALCFILSLTRQTLDEHIVRLCLPTPHDRPLRKPGPKGWSLADIMRLIVWWFAAVHPETIGQGLERQRSANAVRAKARRLGLPRRGRSDLHKPNPSQLREPDVDWLGLGRTDRHEPTLGTRGPDTRHATTGMLADRSGTMSDETRHAAPMPAKPPAPVARAKGTVPGKTKPPRQRELPLLVILRKPTQPADVAPVPPPHDALPPVPTTIDEVDLIGDLRWFRRLTWTNPLKSRVAVWTFFMLIAGGLHYKAAAERLGISSAAFRSIRTRMAVPSDPDRKKAGTRFFQQGAHATLERSGYVIRECKESGNFFWKHRDDRKTHFSPPFRKSEKIIGERGNLFEIVTAAMLSAEKEGRAAHSQLSLQESAHDEPSRTHRCATLQPPSRAACLIPISREPLSTGV